jgi:DNA-binding response OmpR family regulator
MKLLIVEDNEPLVEVLKQFLTSHDFVLECCSDADDAFYLLETNTFDALILDINLGETSGYTVIQRLRKTNNPLPILVISSLSEIDQRVKGINLGADDYLTKPFDNQELLARIQSLLRRCLPVDKNQLIFKELSLDLDSCMAQREGVAISLRKKEFLLLEYLLLNKGVILSRFQLLDRVWGSESEIDSNKVDVHIKNLRRLIDLPFDEGYIKTVRGLGYVIR